MESKRKILGRYRRGEGIRSISRELNILRNTVRSIIRTQGEIKSDYVRNNSTNSTFIDINTPTHSLGDYCVPLKHSHL